MFGGKTPELMRLLPSSATVPLTEVSKKKKNKLMNRQIHKFMVKQFGSLIISVLNQKEHVNLQVMFGFRGHHHFNFLD